MMMKRATGSTALYLFMDEHSTGGDERCWRG